MKSDNCTCNRSLFIENHHYENYGVRVNSNITLSVFNIQLNSLYGNWFKLCTSIFCIHIHNVFTRRTYSLPSQFYFGSEILSVILKLHLHIVKLPFPYFRHVGSPSHDRAIRSVPDTSITDALDPDPGHAYSASANEQTPTVSTNTTESTVSSTTSPNEDHQPYAMATVENKTEVVLPNLRHFQEYNIQVRQ